jgi:hypothetical protein
MGVVPCCWKPSWMRPVFAEPATRLPTGFLSGKPLDAAAWTVAKMKADAEVASMHPPRSVPLARDLPRAQRQDLAGQSLNLHPGEVHHIMPTFLRPSRSTIAGIRFSDSLYAFVAAAGPPTAAGAAECKQRLRDAVNDSIGIEPNC